MHAFLRDTTPGDAHRRSRRGRFGGAGEIGLIKLAEGGLHPGSGTNKKLRSIGDVAILGIVAERSLFNYALLSLTRLKLVWQIADRIAEGIARYASDAAASVQRAHIA